MFRVKVAGGWTGCGSVLAASNWLRDGDGWGKESPGRRTGSSARCDWVLLGYLVERVLLIVTVHLEYHGLALHVLNEGPGDSHRDVLHVVEVQGCPFPIVFQWFCREGLVMTVDKAENKTVMVN